MWVGVTLFDLTLRIVGKEEEEGSRGVEEEVEVEAEGGVLIGKWYKLVYSKDKKGSLLTVLLK